MTKVITFQVTVLWWGTLFPTAPFFISFLHLFLVSIGGSGCDRSVLWCSLHFPFSSILGIHWWFRWWQVLIVTGSGTDWFWLWMVLILTDGQVVRAGVSVTWNVLSWSGGHEFEPRSDRTWGAWYFCPKSYLNQNLIITDLLYGVPCNCLLHLSLVSIGSPDGNWLWLWLALIVIHWRFWLWQFCLCAPCSPLLHLHSWVIVWRVAVTNLVLWFVHVPHWALFRSGSIHVSCKVIVRINTYHTHHKLLQWFNS